MKSNPIDTKRLGEMGREKNAEKKLRMKKPVQVDSLSVAAIDKSNFKYPPILDFSPCPFNGLCPHGGRDENLCPHVRLIPWEPDDKFEDADFAIQFFAPKYGLTRAPIDEVGALVMRDRDGKIQRISPSKD